MDHYQEIFKKTFERHIPFTVHWELTGRCNLNCIHCYMIRDSDREELSRDEIGGILDQLAREGCLYLVLSGGEPLMRGDFFEIAHAARNKGFALRLFTNGTLITPEIADKIYDLQPLSVEISIYGMDPSIHDEITAIPESYNKTISALRKLNDRGLRTIIKSPIMKQNRKEFRMLKRFAEELGAGFVYDLIIVTRDDGSKAPLNYRLSDRDLTEFLISEADPEMWKPGKVTIDQDDPSCCAGFNTLCISPHGDVYPCVAIKRSAGNLREESLLRILSSENLSKIRSIRFSGLKGCPECQLLPYCNRCMGMALVEDSDIKGPSTAACTMARARRDIIRDA